MIEIATIEALRGWRREQRRGKLRVGFVPTMGSLHEGHLRLVDRARTLSDRTVLSVFVNPTQFGPGEDLDKYPRDRVRDGELAAARDVDCLFAPHTSDVYPEKSAITVSPGPLADRLCGTNRPGHFAGVLLVVLKLLNMVEPDVAIFGRKDAQQAWLIRRMVHDLNVPVIIDVAPIVREPDGLAMSSRNAYLDRTQRCAAAALSRALEAGHRAFVGGDTEPAHIIDVTRAVLANEPAVVVEYVDVVDPTTLATPERAHDQSVLALAVQLGGTRLIDNVPLGAGLSADVFVER